MPRDNPKIIDEVRARAKVLELRDSATMIFTDQATVKSFLPEKAVESLIIEDNNEFELTLEKPANPKIGRLMVVLLLNAVALVGISAFNLR